MAGNFEINVNGDVKAEVGIRAIAGRRDRVETLIYRAARAGAEAERLNVPHESDRHKPTGGFESSIEAEFPRFHPGGAGGGGTWEAKFGPTANARTLRGGFPYPTNVFQGTGLFGPKHRFITPTTGNVMKLPASYGMRTTDRGRPIKPRPGPIFTRYTRGQKENRLWHEIGIARANQYLRRNLRRVFEGTIQH